VRTFDCRPLFFDLLSHCWGKCGAIHPGGAMR
jgi:hypothetical protein